MPDEKLLEFIKASLAHGQPREAIYKVLLEQGYTIEAIQEGFGSQTTKEEKEQSSQKTIHLIVTIGAILVGAGIFSFIAANWDYLSRSAKIGIILTAMLSCYGAGWYVKEKSKLAKTGSALILLGAIIYGAGIFLVAQMFNIRTNWPDGFILWMLGVMLLAWALESYPLFYLAMPLGAIAIFGDPFYILESFGTNPFLFTSTLLLLLSTAATFLVGWHIRKKITTDLKDYY